MSLREYVERIFSERDRAHETRHSSEQRAVDAAFAAMQKALDVAAHEAEKKNQELNDVRHRFIPRETFEAELRARDAMHEEALQRSTRIYADVQAHASLSSHPGSAAVIGRIEALENWRSKAVGVGSMLVLFSGAVGALVTRALT